MVEQRAQSVPICLREIAASKTPQEWLGEVEGRTSRAVEEGRLPGEILSRIADLKELPTYGGIYRFLIFMNGRWIQRS